MAVEYSNDVTSNRVKEIIGIELLKQQNDIEMMRAREIYAMLEEINPARLDEYIPSNGAERDAVTYSSPRKGT